MISVGENKAVLYKGDYHPAEFYKGSKRISGYETAEFSGEGNVSLEDCYNDRLYNAVLEGNSVQDGTPSPENPIEIESVGELQTEGEYAGKYKVSIYLSYEPYAEPEYFDIYLDEPLRKLGEYADYIDFEKGVVVRRIKRLSIKSFAWSKLSNMTMSDGTVLYRYESALAGKRYLKGAYGTIGNLLCDGLRHTRYSYGYTDNSISERVDTSADGTQGTGLTIRILASGYATIADMKSAFGEFKVYYISDDVYVTEESIDVPVIPTKHGYTNVFELTNEIKPVFKGEYKKKE